MWRALLEQFELEPEELDRLALFLLAHAQLDRWLIHATALAAFTRRLKQWGPAIPDVATALDALVARHARGTFATHITRAKSAELLGDRVGICEKVNEARNHFLHWQPGRFKVPTYQGQKITIEEGFLRCLSDIDKVIVGLKRYIDER